MSREKRLQSYITTEIVRTHAAFELAAARLYLRAYRTLTRKKARPELLRAVLEQAEEEIGHYEMLKELHERRWGPIASIVSERAEKIRLPRIAHEADFMAASWIFDLAGILQMRAVADCPQSEYRKLVRKILQEEAGHVSRGRRLFLRALKGRPPSAARALAKRWLPAGLVCFGNPSGPLDTLAVKLGIKRRSARELCTDLTRRVSGARPAGR